MNNRSIYKAVNYFIAIVWLINGLVCKVLNLVPRHTEIVSEILSKDYSRLLTILIGVSEILMALWIISNIKSKLNTILQIILILTMNTLEIILTPHLLLWAKFNLVFAMLFVGLLFFKEFVLLSKTTVS